MFGVLRRVQVVVRSVSASIGLREATKVNTFEN